MDTALRNNPRKAAILVDFDTFSYNSFVQQWLNKKFDKLEIIFLVSDPERNDYNPENVDRFARSAPLVEPAAVLRNTGHLADMAFKTSALCVVQDLSNLIVALAVDEDIDILAMYEQGGVAVALQHTELLGLGF